MRRGGRPAGCSSPTRWPACCPCSPSPAPSCRTSAARPSLRTGRAAAVLSDYPPAAELANGERTRAYFQLASDTQYEPGLYGAAVAKDRPRLRDAVHGALERLMASGEYERVLRSWQVERGAVRQPSINAAAVR